MPVAGDVAVVRNLAGGRWSRKRNESPQATWLGVARTDSLWLCYAKPLAGNQKSEITGIRHGFPGGKLGEKEEISSTERRRK